MLRISGAHHVFGRANPFGRVTVPVHGNQTLPTGTQKAIMKDAGLVEGDL